MILVVTDAFDAHADSVISYLRAIDASFFRLDLDKDSLLDTYVSIENDTWCIQKDERSVRSGDIKCVWARRLTVSINIEDETDADPGFKLWKGEWNRCLFGLYGLVRDASWVNPIGASSLIDNKFYQMLVAKDCGFSIPRFLMSNNISSLLRFTEEHGDVALKFLAQDVFKSKDGEVRGTYVNKINKFDLQKFAAREENPVLVQKYVDKKYEVRLTFVDGKCFACRIESQSSSRANIDWRRYDIAGTPHYQITAPSAVEVIIKTFMARASLVYGAFDFVVDREDRWWYLEVNSAGQWLWIEDLVQLPISQAVAECLAKRSMEIST